MDKVSFIVETLANINQSILLIYFLCGTLNVNKKINSKIAVISGVSIIFAYLEIQYMVVPFEGLGVAAIEAQLNGLPCVCSFGVPDTADISDKFLKCSFNAAEWIDVIISMGRPNKLAGVVCL